MSDRLKAIQEEQKKKEQGSYGVQRKWYINSKKLDELKIDQYKAHVMANFLRIVPPADPNKYFGLQIFVHYNIGPNGDAYLCPKMMKGEKCRLCNKRDQLKAAGAEDDVLRSLSCFPPRYLFFVVDRTSKETEANGVQLYDACQTINDEILGLSQDRRTKEMVDISDPDNGKLLVFDRKGTGARDTKYSAFAIEPDDPIPDAWLEVPNFADILHYGTESEILASMGCGGEPDDNLPGVTPETKAESTPRARTRTVTPPAEKEPAPEVKPQAEPSKTESAPVTEQRPRRRISRDEEAPAAPQSNPADGADDQVRSRLRAKLAERRGAQS